MALLFSSCAVTPSGEIPLSEAGATQVEPGLVNLAGVWQTIEMPSASEFVPEPDQEGWREVELPSSWDQWSRQGEVVWLSRTVTLEPGWQENLAPGGLALLVGGRNGSQEGFRVVVAGRTIAEFSGPRMPFGLAPSELIPIPSELVGQGDTFDLMLSFERQGWDRSQSTPGLGPVGDFLFLGDQVLLSAIAETRARAQILASMPQAILVILLATIGLFQLYIFSRRTQARDYLWFGLLTFGAASVVGFYQWLPHILETDLWAYRLYEAGTHLLTIGAMQFLMAYLNKPFARHWRFYQYSQLLLAAMVLLAPQASWLLASRGLRLAWGLPAWGFLLAILARYTWESQKRDERFVGFIGMVAALSTLLEWCVRLSGREVDHSVSLWIFGTFAVVLSASLAERFDRVHSELDGLRQQLERMVEDRTQELEAANEKLKAEIAERSLAEEAMRMLERAVEQSIDGILVTDLEGMVQFVNEAWAQSHDYEVFEVLGRSVEMFHSEQQMQKEIWPCFEKVQESGAFEGEIGHRRKQGEIFPAWMTVTLLRGPELEPVGFVVLGRDITERRKAQEERETLEAKVLQAKKLESLGGLAGGIANDYNSLLTNVLSNSSLLLRSLTPESTATEKIRQIEIAAERAAELTGQLLAYAGEDPLVLQKVDINGLLVDHLPELSRFMPVNVQLDWQPGKDLPEVRLDPVQILRAVSNLVRNAAAAMRGTTGSVVSVSTTGPVAKIILRTSLARVDRGYFRGAYLDEGQPAGEYLRLEVIDQGVGIDKATKAKMFDPFFSTHASSRGLGLATVLGIVRAHGGVIRLHSKEDEGTNFEILLTLTLESAEESHELANLREWSSAGTILVVDDEELMLDVSESILQMHGFRTLVAADGRQALDQYRQHQSEIRLVILDRKMPGMDGGQVLREIRSLNAKARVLLMSGYKEQEATRSLEGQWISGFLQKPFRPDDLTRRIYDILESEE